MNNHIYQAAADRFGIDPEVIQFYHSGICYDRIEVTTQEAADAVSAKVKGQSVNGGMLDGMPLGSQRKQDDGSISIHV